MSILNKRVSVLIAVSMIFILAYSGSVFAAINETEQINQGYNWLSASLRDKWTNISVEDNAISLLALSYDDTLAKQGKDVLVAKSNNSECWPASGCKVKDTALATLALSKICIDVTKPQDWLMNKNSTPTDLIWYLQIDNQGESNCSVSYDGKEYKFKISEDKKLSNAAGSCLTLGFGSYWFKIASSCLDKTFTVSCDKDFAATLVYQKPSDSTYYVSSDTKKESASGFADLKISAICIKEGFSCSYEGTLLTALALQDKVDKNLFLPYLIAYANKNARYFPEAYLLKFSGLQDYADRLFYMQKSTGYWLASSSINGKYYDTALALNALTDFSSEKTERAKTWLLNEQVKTGANSGSWQASKKDTAFVLYSLWPKEASCISDSGRETIACEASGRHCISSGDCNSEDIDEGHQCTGFDVCCNEEKQLKTCAAAGGILCDLSLNCNGYNLPAISDVGTGKQCCSEACTEPSTNTETECQQKSYTCSFSDCVAETEQEVSYACATNSEKCCAPSSTTEPTKSGFKWWIVILIILVLGIILFLLRGKLGKPTRKRPATGMLSNAGFGGPPGFGSSGMSRPMPSSRPMPVSRPAQFTLPRGAVRPAFNPRASLKKTETDKELDDTLKKLEEISK